MHRGPGAYTDIQFFYFLPFLQLTIGNFGLSEDQERAQMAMWSVLASPLLMSMDACNTRQSSKAILQNKRIIAVNQDRLGKQGILIIKVCFFLLV